MTLKYKVTTAVNPNYNEERIRNKIRAIIQMKSANKLLKFNPNKPSDADLKVFADTGKNLLRMARVNLNTLQSICKNNKVIKITSDRVWNLYKENIEVSTGLTKYNSFQFEVNTEVAYDKLNGENIMSVIKETQELALTKLRENRKIRKEIPFEEREFYVQDLPIRPKYTVYKGGGYGGSAREVIYKDSLRGTEYKYNTCEVSNQFFIHMKPNTFLELQEAKNLKKIFERKVPLTNAHHVGVEIEFVSKLDKYELAKELKQENVQDFVCLVDDGSIRKIPGFNYAHELTIIAPESLIHLVLMRALRAINKNGMSRVGGRCGLHVHLDMRNRDKHIVYHNLFKAQRILYAMNPRSRIDGIDSNGNKDTVYSKKVEWQDFETAWQALDNGNSSSRYNGINLLALNKHNTIEIRIHTGSTNFEKISNWVKILTSIANLTSKVNTEAHKAETFCEYYNLDSDVLSYIKMRIAKFKDQNGKHITVEEVA